MNRHLRRVFALLSQVAGALLLLAFVEIVALSAAPAWHEWAHAHAAQDDCAGHGHEQRERSGADCAVSIFAGGGWQGATLAPLWLLTPVVLEEEAAAEGSQPLAATRLRGILEHAPPRNA